MSNMNNKRKNVFLAFILGLIFGPFGLLYVGLPHFLFGLVLYVGCNKLIGGAAMALAIWVICSFWGLMVALAYNDKIDTTRGHDKP